MPEGKCILLTESGEPYAVRVDHGGGHTIDVDVDRYNQQGYLPPLDELKPCPGMERRAKPWKA